MDEVVWFDVSVVGFWAVKIGMILCSEHCMALLTLQTDS